MKKAEVQKLVEEGFALDQEIKTLSSKAKRLEEIKGLLKDHAGEKPMDIAAEGCVAEVSFPSQAVRMLDAEALVKARKIAGESFEILFGASPIAKFSDIAPRVLGEKKGAELVEICSRKSGRISFKAA